MMLQEKVTARAESQEEKASVQDGGGESPTSDGKTTDSSATEVDGGWGWVVLATIFSMNLLNFGHFRSFGLYIQPMMATLGATPSQVAWVTSIQHGLFSFLGPVASTLTTIVGPRNMALIGGVSACLGLALSFTATSIVYIYCTFSIFGAIGVSFTSLPALVMISVYFKKRRGLANGLMMSGNAVGGMVFPMLVERLLEEFGLQGTMLIAGGLLLHICVGAMLWRPPVRPKHPHATKTGPLASERGSDGRDNPSFESPDEKTNEVSSVSSTRAANGDTTVTADVSTQERASKQTFHVSQSNHSSKEQKNKAGATMLSNLWVLQRREFWVFTVCKVCMMATVPALRIFVPLWAIHVGCTQHDIATIFTVMAAADFLGRITISGVSDWCAGAGRCRLFAACLALGGLASAVYSQCRDTLTLSATSAVFGFFTGASLGLGNSVIADIFGGSAMAPVAGMCNVFTGVAGLLGPPALGYIVETTGNYLLSQIIASSLILFGTVTYIIGIILMKPKYSTSSGKDVKENPCVR